jgi:uncharacterized surface protein with fasciclin (FAS1) repeats
MKYYSFIAIISIFYFFSACKQEWEDHYGIYPEAVEQNIWDAIQNETAISEFVQAIKAFNYDTLFQTDIPYTVFIPTNDAFTEYISGGNTVDQLLLDFHFSPHFIQSGNITGKRKVQTLGKKFALLEKSGNELKFNDIKLIKESPLYVNGKYYIMEKVAKPLPNIYEYFVMNNPVLREYIDSKDSVILDMEKSKPIGFDENGNTVYDSVSIIYNEFEDLYFPVRKEFRNKTATIVFPQKNDYENALTIMSQNLGGDFTDYRDIPMEWQQNVLVPHLLTQGVFENLLEPEVFIWKSSIDTVKLKNIQGDSIPIFYTPVDKVICSNGYVYNYENFVIPDSLYSGTNIFEAEWLLDRIGINRYYWNERAKVTTDQSFEPNKEYINTASNDSILRVLFSRGYSGRYSLEFYSENLFPGKYVMVVSTHMDIGGIYDIYINDELVKSFDYYDFVRYRGIMPSVTETRYIPVGRFNKFDMWVNNIHEYGRVKIRLEYKEPGRVLENGLVIDCISFVLVN